MGFRHEGKARQKVWLCLGASEFKDKTAILTVSSVRIAVFVLMTGECVPYAQRLTGQIWRKGRIFTTATAYAGCCP